MLLLSPRPDTDEAFEALADGFASAAAPVPVRIVHGDGSHDPPPRPGAALVTGGQPEALAVAASVSEPGWRWVHLTSSGTDHLRDWPPLPGDPLVTYSRGVNSRSIAEWSLAAMLHFYRDLDHYTHKAYAGSPDERWDRRWARELSGERLLVLGAGRAGVETARLAELMGLHSVGISRSGQRLPGFARVLTPEHTKDELAVADITLVLLPSTPETRGAVGAAEIQAMRPGSLLLVASRGGIVDEEAVLSAVRSGHLHGAAFDVFAEEPLPGDSPLWGEPRILVTPHVAGTTDRFMERTGEIVETIWRSAFLEPDPQAIARYRYDASVDAA